MSWRRAAALALVAAILPTTATAAVHSAEPIGDIYSPGIRMLPSKLPSDEALALGRRLALALDSGAIARRTAELVAMARRFEPPRPKPPSYPNGPIRAIPSIDPDYPDWGFPVQQRVVDHAGLVYARYLSVAEMRQMIELFESPAGKRLAETRLAPSEEVQREISTKLLEDDLWSVVCLRTVSTTEKDAPHHEFERLHPPMDYPLPPPPRWCGQVPPR